MRVIGVVDLRGGSAVHAVAGVRERYEPVRRIAWAPLAAGDAIALVRGYREQLGIEELYVADLDAIAGSAPQRALVTGIAHLGSPVWLDAGVSSVERARDALALGADRVVVGLETLSSFDALEAICRALGDDRVAFSLDVRDGVPMLAAGGHVMPEAPHRLAARAADAGAGAVIVIDLARVGTGRTPDAALIGRVRAAAPSVVLLAGGGVRESADLGRLAGAGCDGALVATALHTGAVDAAAVAAARQERW
jgi:phosphoribosylformimino-5-aminoimidazole carboxamide ribotide isomerase